MFNFLRRKKKVKKDEPIKPIGIREWEEEFIEEKIEEAEEKQELKEERKKERKLSYHITKHPKGGWQIKKGKADRALKRFDTQKEAIEHAKQLEKERGISYIIHKADGSTRKKKY